MRSSFLRYAVAALGVILLAAVVPGFGEDYLVIKKKGGPTQKVPLTFPPEQIESFHVESGPATGAAPRGPAPSEGLTAPSTERPGGEPPGFRAEPKPLELRPAVPKDSPMILRRGPEAQRGPATTPAERPQRREGPAWVEGKVISGPVAAELPKAKGNFFVNIYKLPDNVRALPDYSAFGPTTTITADTINLDTARGDKEPADIPANTEGLGMRFMGLFAVSGEGIFQWRVHSKDGVRLHVDDKTLIENDGIHPPTSKTGYLHLAEGVHAIVLDSFNSQGSPILKLFVTPPLGQEQLFSIKEGLAGWKEPAKPYDVLWGQVYFVPKGKYPEGPDFARMTPIGRLVAPELSITGGEGIPGLPGRKDMVGIRYTGYFNVVGAGIFAFRTVADHYAKIFIGDKEIAEVTGGLKSNPDGKVGWAFLQKGSYPIRVDYFHPEGSPNLQLFVTEPLKTEELFRPSHTLEGYSTEEGKVSLIPVFAYFLKAGTKTMPNFNKLTPAGMFFTNSVDYPIDRGSREFPGVPKRDAWLGLRFYVKFSLSDAESGNYKFRVVCRDAARLIIGKKLVIGADAIGRTQDKSGSLTMEAGSHEMFLDYIQTTGPNGIQLFITPPGGEEKVFAFQ